MHDLRSFLSGHDASVWRLPDGMSVRHEITALQHGLDAQGLFPILLAAAMRLPDGRVSGLPVVSNLTASRILTASALGIEDHRATAQWFAERSARGLDPLVVAPGEAPVQQCVQRENADLTALPALLQHELEPGPYLTAAHATTFDPETGIDNSAIQRCWIQGPRRMTLFPYPGSHNARNLAKFHARNEPCPVAFWIGHHPAVLLGSQAKLRYPESHWRAAGGVLGEPLRIVPTLTHGRSLMVPADAEIVVEGFISPDSGTPDGPFGEYTGYLGPRADAYRVDVHCITMRRNAIYHDYGSGLTDMLVPDNMAMEGKLFQMVRAVAPSLRNVHVPASGRRFHAWLQLADAGRGEARDALLAALAYRRVKTVAAFDTDVDIFSPDSVMWALATRVQWSRDSIAIDGLSGSTLDPSLAPGAPTASKLGIDATLPRRGAADTPRVATVPAASRERANTLLRGAIAGQPRWPRS